MMVIAGRLPKHLAVETLWEVPSVMSPDHCQLLHHLDGRHPSLCCLFVRWCRQHVGHLVHPVRPGFYCSQPGHDAGVLHCCICCFLHIVIDHLRLCIHCCVACFLDGVISMLYI
jgi:hypothetical protein